LSPELHHSSVVQYRQGSTPKLTNYIYIDSHAYILKEKKKEQA